MNTVVVLHITHGQVVCQISKLCLENSNNHLRLRKFVEETTEVVTVRFHWPVPHDFQEFDKSV
jgi:hypothetical protein